MAGRTSCVFQTSMFAAAAIAVLVACPSTASAEPVRPMVGVPITINDPPQPLRLVVPKGAPYRLMCVRHPSPAPGEPFVPLQPEVSASDKMRLQTIGGSPITWGETQGPITSGATLGDINGNGSINADDFEALRAAFSTLEGETGYNPAADLDGDKAVTLADQAILLRTATQGQATALNVLAGSTGPREVVISEFMGDTEIVVEQQEASGWSVFSRKVVSRVDITAGPSDNLSIFTSRYAVIDPYNETGLDSWLYTQPTVSEIIQDSTLSSGPLSRRLPTSYWPNGLLRSFLGAFYFTDGGSRPIGVPPLQNFLSQGSFAFTSDGSYSFWPDAFTPTLKFSKKTPATYGVHSLEIRSVVLTVAEFSDGTIGPIIYAGNVAEEVPILRYSDIGGADATEEEVGAFVFGNHESWFLPTLWCPSEGADWTFERDNPYYLHGAADHVTFRVASYDNSGNMVDVSEPIQTNAYQSTDPGRMSYQVAPGQFYNSSGYPICSSCPILIALTDVDPAPQHRLFLRLIPDLQNPPDARDAQVIYLLRGVEGGSIGVTDIRPSWDIP